MITKLKDIYLKINYSGQKIGNPLSVSKGLINLIFIEFSLITSGFLIGLIAVLGLTSPILGAIIVGGYVFVIWTQFYSKIEEGIEFEKLEKYYQSINKSCRRTHFILMILILIACFILMLFLIKLIILIS